MKKLLAIIVLGLLWFNTSLAEKISLKDCYQEPFAYKFDSKIYEKNEIIIDTDTDKLTMIFSFTDSEIENRKKKNPKQQHQKIIIDSYNIIFKDKNYIKAEFRPSTTNELFVTYVVDLDNKKIQTTYSKIPNLNGTIFCQ